MCKSPIVFSYPNDDKIQKIPEVQEVPENDAKWNSGLPLSWIALPVFVRENLQSLLNDVVEDE